VISFDIDRDSISPQSAAPTSVDSSDLDSLTDQQLDAVPFGVICLDAEGTILRYNLYESRLARLDVNQVLGRDFFEEVARCTRGPGFEGHFRRVAAGNAMPDDLRFDYVFDFTFGAQTVGVEIVAVSGAPRFYLLINRTRIDERRVDAPEVAVLQRELAPDELDQGLRRDEFEQRAIDVPLVFFTALRATFGKLAPEAWPTFAHEWGIQWGRRAAIDLDAGALEMHNIGLAGRPMKDVADAVGHYFEARGWGKVQFDFQAIQDGLFEAKVHRSALAEAVPARPLSPRQGEPACALLAGAFAGVFGHVASRRLASRELRCVTQGAPQCHFVLVAAERAGRLDEALAESASIDIIRRTLAKRR
jgi:photoactive yellow protein